jgi:hypothetical protein
MTRKIYTVLIKSQESKLCKCGKKQQLLDDTWIISVIKQKSSIQNTINIIEQSSQNNQIPSTQMTNVLYGVNQDL